MRAVAAAMYLLIFVILLVCVGRPLPPIIRTLRQYKTWYRGTDKQREELEASC